MQFGLDHPSGVGNVRLFILRDSSVYVGYVKEHSALSDSGIILLIIVYVKGRKAGAFGSSNYWGVEGAVKYWHFVDVAWIFIYPTLYLVK